MMTTVRASVTYLAERLKLKPKIVTLTGKDLAKKGLVEAKKFEDIYCFNILKTGVKVLNALVVIPCPDKLERSNGGQVCDVLKGPCACGATH
jgi:hypothetical protein